MRAFSVFATPSAYLEVNMQDKTHITQNPRLLQALRDYHEVIRQVRYGTAHTAQAQRDQLRAVYRLLAGK